MYCQQKGKYEHIGTVSCSCLKQTGALNNLANSLGYLLDKKHDLVLQLILLLAV